MDNLQPLVGDVKTQFACPMEGLEQRIEEARLEQEAMCGYPLVLKGTRTAETYDGATNRLVIEVFATFAPTPEAIQQEAAENAATKAEGEAMRAAHLAATHSD